MIRQRPQWLAQNVSHKVACTSANTTQTKAGNGCNDCVEFTHTPTKLRCTTSPNTTQMKPGNGRNDCAEFTHAPTSHAAPSPQTQQHKQKLAMAATIVRNLPMHPQVMRTHVALHGQPKKI